MKGTIRWLLGEVFTGTSLSNRALAIYAPLAVVAAAFTMPLRLPADEAETWLIALAAQVVFTTFVVILRPLTQWRSEPSRRWLSIGIVITAGALRGMTLALLAARSLDVTIPASDIAVRGINSALISMLSIALIGAVLQYTKDYRSEFILLRDRAQSLRRLGSSDVPPLDSNTIAQWVGVRESLSATAASARMALQVGQVSPESLRQAAAVVEEVLHSTIRPVSHNLWSQSKDEVPRLRVLALAWDALRPWQPPVLLIAAIYFVISSIGAVARVGFTTGIVFALYMTAGLTFLVWTSREVGSRYAQSRLVGLVTISGLPFLLFGLTQLVGQGILHEANDIPGAVMAGTSASVVVIAMVYLTRVTAERELLLAALQTQIDVQGMELLGRASARQWDRQLGAFVHHSVQSELTALRLKLIEASDSSDPATLMNVREEAITRFDRLLTLDPPWLTQSDGRSVVEDVAEAWSGIASITYELTDHGTSEQWRLVGQVVEEGVANAVRAGGAREIEVSVTSEGGDLCVVIRDDGQGLTQDDAPGLGSLWLDQIAPGAWSRIASSSGTALQVTISVT